MRSVFRSRKKFSTTYALIPFSPDLSMEVSNSSNFKQVMIYYQWNLRGVFFEDCVQGGQLGRFFPKVAFWSLFLRTFICLLYNVSLSGMSQTSYLEIPLTLSLRNNKFWMLMCIPISDIYPFNILFLLQFMVTTTCFLKKRYVTFFNWKVIFSYDLGHFLLATLIVCIMSCVSRVVFQYVFAPRAGDQLFLLLRHAGLRPRHRGHHSGSGLQTPACQRQGRGTEHLFIHQGCNQPEFWHR